MIGRRLPDWFIVARREFLERVRTVWFLIVTILGPLGMAAMIIVPAWIAHKGAKQEARVHVVDRSVDAKGQPTKLGEEIISFADRLKLKFKFKNVAANTSRKELLDLIRREKIDGFLEIPKDGMDGGTILYRGSNATNLQVTALLHQVVNFAVRSKKNNISPEKLLALIAPVPFDSKHTTGEEGGSAGGAKLIIGYVMLLLLYVSIILYGNTVCRSVAEEKSSRVVELMVSAVKPRSLMWGKIIGVGGVGLFQLSIWGAMGFLLLTYRVQLLGAFGVGGATFSIPGVSLGTFAIMIAYFIVGYFFYAALYAAIGAMVNSEQEAQQAQMPVALILMVPLACAPLLANNPRSGATELLTMIPFSSPLLMPIRYLLGGATVTDVLVSMFLLVAATAVVVWVAARIYRVGILMYGKRPSLRELARWIRYT